MLKLTNKWGVIQPNYQDIYNVYFKLKKKKKNLNKILKYEINLPTHDNLNIYGWTLHINFELRCYIVKF
jgi:hypothetical protein